MTPEAGTDYAGFTVQGRRARRSSRALHEIGLGGRRRHRLPHGRGPRPPPPRCVTPIKGQAPTTRSSSRRARRCATSSASPASRTRDGRRGHRPGHGQDRSRRHGLRVDVLAPEASATSVVDAPLVTVSGWPARPPGRPARAAAKRQSSPASRRRAR